MIRLKEVVDFSKTQDIEKRLSAIPRELSEDTFGIDMEFHTNDPDNPPSINVSNYADQFEHDVRYNRRAQGAYEEWIDDQRNEIGRKWRGDIDRWDDSYGPVDVDLWDKYNSEPEREDFSNDDDYSSAHDDWESTRDDIESAYDKWERLDRDDFIEDWVNEVISDGTWDNYFTVLSSDDDNYDEGAEENTDDAIARIYNNGKTAHEMKWETDHDGADIMEVRTPPLTYTEQNLNILKQVMEFCHGNYWARGDTSAHVHVGVPKDMTIFDLLAATTLVDEKAVQQDISADRELHQFSALADTLHSSIIKAIERYLDSTGERKLEQLAGKSFTVENTALEGFVQKNVRRESGTNIKAFFIHKTIEFRYFSSQIYTKFEIFKKWIKYFMLLPKIAQSRNQFVIGKNALYSLVFARKDKKNTKITILDKDGRMPKSPDRPSSYLRTKEPDTKDPEHKKVLARLKQKLKDPKQPELDFRNLP